MASSDDTDDVDVKEQKHWDGKGYSTTFRRKQSKVQARKRRQEQDPTRNSRKYRVKQKLDKLVQTPVIMHALFEIRNCTKKKCKWTLNTNVDDGCHQVTEQRIETASMVTAGRKMYIKDLLRRQPKDLPAGCVFFQGQQMCISCFNRYHGYKVSNHFLLSFVARLRLPLLRMLLGVPRPSVSE